MRDQDYSATDYSEAQNWFILKIKIKLMTLFWKFSVTKTVTKFKKSTSFILQSQIVRTDIKVFSVKSAIYRSRKCTAMYFNT